MSWKILIRWTPRVLAILLASMLLLLSMDVFEEGLALSEVLIGFMMHNIPTFILVAIIVLAWKWPVIGAFGFIAAGITYSIMMFGSIEDMGYGPILILGLPALVTGILFGADAYMMRKQQ